MVKKVLKYKIQKNKKRKNCCMKIKQIIDNKNLNLKKKPERLIKMAKRENLDRS